MLTLAPAAVGDTFRPSTTGDNPNRGLTLREAVTRANNRAGGDRIVLEGGRTYNLRRPNAGGVSENANATGDLNVRGLLRIVGQGRGQATIDANGIDRVLETNPDGPVGVSLARLRLTGGDTTSDDVNGGAISMHDGRLTLTESSVADNVAGSNGGGIHVFSSETILTLDRSRVRNNVGGGNGGGIYNFAGDITTHVARSTISGNQADSNGGGLFSLSARGTLRRSTISGNSSNRGGGLFVQGSLSRFRAANSTVAGNTAQNEGGGADIGETGLLNLRSVTVAFNLANADGTDTDNGGGLNADPTADVGVRNSIIARNRVLSPGVGPDCAGAFSSAGRNMLTSDAGCTGFPEPPNIITSRPRIATLDDNGGPTKTVALRRGSPAVDRAGAGSPNRDQRGVTRDDRGGPDIGAFERR